MSSVESSAPSRTLQLMRSRAYRGWVLGLFLLISMFGFVDRQVIGSLAQPIKVELGLSDSQLGFLGGLAFALFNAGLTIPIARLADTRRRLTIISIGVFLWSIATCLCGLARSFPQLVFARLCVGVGEAAGTPATTSVLADYFPRDRRTSAAAIFVLSVPLGALIGSAGGGFIAQHANWRMAFVAAGLPGLVLGLLLMLTVREPVRGHYDQPGLGEQGAPPFGAVLRRMIQRPAFLHVMLGSTIASMGGFGINLFIAAYFVRRFGLDYTQSGLLAGLISAIPGSVSMLGGGLLADALGRRDARFYAWLPGLGALLATPLYILSFLQGNWAGALTLLMITGVFQYAYLPVSAGVSANIMEPRMRASAAAVVGIMTNLVGAGLAPLIVGSLSDAFTHRFALASAAGLQWACMVFAGVYLWAAVHFALAARTIRRDMA